MDVSSNGLADYSLWWRMGRCRRSCVSIEGAQFLVAPVAPLLFNIPVDSQGCNIIFLIQFTKHISCHSHYGCNWWSFRHWYYWSEGTLCTVVLCTFCREEDTKQVLFTLWWFTYLLYHYGYISFCVESFILLTLILVLHPSFKLSYFGWLNWEKEWVDNAVKVTQDAWTRFKPSTLSLDTLQVEKASVIFFTCRLSPFPTHCDDL